MFISEDDTFADDPHQIILTDDIFALPFLLRQNLEDLTMVTTFHPRLLHSGGPTITSQVMLDLATLVHLPSTILLINKDL